MAEGEDRHGHFLKGKVDDKPLCTHRDVPGNHLFLFVGGDASTAQNLGRSREEVQAVVLEVLIDEWQEDLGKVKAGLNI